MLLPALVTTLSFSPVLQETPKDARQLLDRYDAARCQSDHHQRKSLHVKGSFQVTGMGKAPYEELFLGREKVRINTEFPGYGAQSQGTNGKFSWSTDPGFGVMIQEGTDQAPVHRTYAVFRGDPWKQIYSTAQILAAEEGQEEGVVRLRMTTAEGTTDTWWVDVQEQLLRGFAVDVPGPQGEVLPMKWEFDDYQALDCCSFPHQKVQKIGKIAIQYDVSEVQSNAELTADLLAPPEKALAAFDDPSRQSPRATAPGDCLVQAMEMRHAATIRMKIKGAEMSRTLAVVLPEVMRHLGKIGVTPAGPPFSRFHSIDGEIIDLEAGMPVAAPISEGGRVKSVELPGGQIATTWHTGPYHTLSQSHQLLEGWISDQGLESRGAFWEVYWTDPGIEPDPNQWRTQILWPVSEL